MVKKFISDRQEENKRFITLAHNPNRHPNKPMTSEIKNSNKDTTSPTTPNVIKFNKCKNPFAMDKTLGFIKLPPNVI